jgi:hypothetical protein
MSATANRRRAVIALVAVIAGAILVWLLFVKDDDGGSDSSAAAQKTVTVYSAAELPGAAASAGQPVYWLGPRPGDQYELTVISDGRAYVRYLPKGVPAESGQAYATVGSYVFEDPVSELEKLGRRPGSHTFPVPGGGVGMATGSRTPNVYVAYPNQAIEIEVFDPQAGTAEKSAKSGELVPIR